MSRVAAFFDIDGTLLLPPTLERRLLRYLAWRGEISLSGWLHSSFFFAWRVWRDPIAATHGNKAHYAGVRVAAIEAFCSLFHRYPLALRPLVLARLRWHTEQGHRIILLSGTLQPLAESVARAIASQLTQSGPSRIQAIATQLEVRNGICTGRTMGPAMCGPQKAFTMRRLAEEQGIDLARSFAYGDCVLDRGMLEAVGHPFVVRPSLRLRRLARRNNWPVLELNSALDSNSYAERVHPRVAV